MIFLWSERDEEHIRKHDVDRSEARMVVENHPLPASRYKPLTKAQRQLLERMRRAGATGRALVDTLGLDSNLLSEAARYARRKKLTITQVVERGLRRELAVRD